MRKVRMAVDSPSVWGPWSDRGNAETRPGGLKMNHHGVNTAHI